MNPNDEQAHARITDLQARLQDISNLLIAALGTGNWRDDALGTTLNTAIRAIGEVRADMASACQQGPDATQTADTNIADDTMLRSISEVASGEFDVQG